MSDWSEPFEARLRYMDVDPVSWRETGPVAGVLAGGSITHDADDPIKTSASIDVTDAFDPRGLVRIYLDALFSSGAKESVCLGTFGATVPTWKRSDSGASGRADLYGCLSLAQDVVPPVSVHVSGGQDPVAAAASCLQAAGLLVQADGGPQRLSEARTYGLVPVDGVQEDRLSIATDLCHAAGFKDPVTDPYGRALLHRQLDDLVRAPDWRWVEGPHCRFLPSMDDTRETPKANCIKVVASTGKGSVVATARCDDPAIFGSTRSLGRELWEVVRPTEEMDQAKAQETADKTLRERMATTHKVSLQHIFCPAALTDVVDLAWPTGGVSGRYLIKRISIDLGAPGLLMNIDLEEVC